jgi:hypothetical protein
MFNAVPYDARPFDGTQVNIPVPPGLLLPVSWFLVLQPGGVLGSAALGPFRDDDAFIGSDIADPATSIVGLLEATGEFDEGGVIFASGPDRARDTSQMGRVVVITPTGYSSRNEGSQRRKLRTVSYLLTIQYRAEEIADARAESDRLTALIHDTLEPASLGGFTKPWLNNLSAGRYDDSRHPEIRVTLNGSFAYAFDSSTGMRTST